LFLYFIMEESSTVKLQQVVLTGSNFHQWSHSIYHILTAAGLKDSLTTPFVPVDPEQKATPEQLKAEAKESKAMCLFMQSLSPSIQTAVRLQCSNTAVAYQFVSNRYRRVYNLQVNTLTAELYKLEFKAFKDLNEFLNKINTLKEQINSIASDEREGITEARHLAIICAALKREVVFSTVIRTIELSPSMDLATAIVHLQAEEADFNKHDTNKPNKVASFTAPTDLKTCVGCNKQGHNLSECFHNPARIKKPHQQQHQQRGHSFKPHGPPRNSGRPVNNRPPNFKAQSAATPPAPRKTVLPFISRAALAAFKRSDQTPRPPKSVPLPANSEFRIPVSFMLDSGSEVSIVRQLSWLSGTQASSFEGEAISGEVIALNTKGMLSTTSFDLNDVHSSTDKDKAVFNLLSVGHLTAKGCDVHFSRNAAVVRDHTGRFLFAARRMHSTNTFWVNLHVELPSVHGMPALVDDDDEPPQPPHNHDDSAADNPPPLLTDAELEDALERVSPLAAISVSSKSNLTLDYWHQCLGHASEPAIRRYLKDNGFKVNDGDVLHQCIACTASKLKAKPHPPRTPETSPQATAPMQCISADVMGPFLPTFSGYRYALSIVDEYSGSYYALLLRRKSDAFDEFKNWMIKTSNSLRMSLSCFAISAHCPFLAKMRLDNGGELKSNEFLRWCAANGIETAYTLPASPQQDGAAERAHYTLLSASRAARISARLPDAYWGQALLHVITPLNCIPDSTGVSPYELFYGVRPDVDLRPFGAVCYMKRDQPKAKPQSVRCRLIGYCNRGRAYIVEELTSAPGRGTVHRTADVSFVDPNAVPVGLLEQGGIKQPPSSASSSAVASSAPAEANNQSVSIVATDNLSVNVNAEPAVVPPPPPAAAQDDMPFALDDQPEQEPEPEPDQEPDEFDHHIQDEPELADLVYDTDQDDEDEDEKQAAESPAVPARPVRLRQPPRHLQDFAVDLPPALAAVRSVSNVADTVSDESNHDVDTLPAQLPHPVPDESVPPNASTALQNPEWKASMITELQSLINNQTFKSVDVLPVGTVPLKTVWVFRRKLMPDGSTKLKSRLCVLGNRQIAGMHFDPHDLAAPVLRQSSLRLIFSYAATTPDATLEHGDVRSAFTCPTLEDHVVYICRPDGMPDTMYPGVRHFLLFKALYGLRQSPRVFHEYLKERMAKIGFQQSVSDCCVFWRYDANGALQLVGCHVDDLLLLSAKFTVAALRNDLAKVFDLSWYGFPSLYLGMECNRLPTGTITLTHSAYIKELLSSNGLIACASKPTPMQTGQELKARQPHEPPASKSFRSVLGAVSYLASTSRPDIAFAVNAIARFMSNPSSTHEQALKRVLRYLAGAPNVGLAFRAFNPSVLTPPLIEGFCDSNHPGSNTSDGRSITGYCVFHRGNLIMWRSKKQTRITHSVTQSELVALATLLKDAQYFRNLTSELRLCSSPPTVPIGCDNQALSLLALSGHVSDALKHVAAIVLAVKEANDLKEISVRHVDSESNVSDVLTKAVDPVRFAKLVHSLGMQASK
jgi:hypothetical protein